MHRFDASRTALAAYDAGWEERAIRLNADPAVYEASEAEAVRAVRLAFVADTADVNNMDQAMGVQLQWVREFVAEADRQIAEAERKAAAEPVTLNLPF